MVDEPQPCSDSKAATPVPGGKHRRTGAAGCGEYRLNG